MYRDSANPLDEHDRAVGAILIAEALVASCDRAIVRLRADATPYAERWRAVTDIHDTYPEIWRHLDRARRELAGRGDNTMKFDELRPAAPRAATGSDESAAEPTIDTTALDAAKCAIAELKLAVPGADWDAIDRRTQGLVNAPLVRRRRYFISVFAAITAFALVATTWFVGMLPKHKPDPEAELRRELADLGMRQQQRLGTLLVDVREIEARCDAPRAGELARLLAQQGHGEVARQFAAQYFEHCQSDRTVEMWARAPLQHHRR
jgi:hypothetical protein